MICRARIRLQNLGLQLDGHVKELSEDADWERVAREIAVKTTKEKIKFVDTAEKKAATVEKVRAQVEKRSAKLLEKQNVTNLKLAEVVSLNTA